MRTLRIPGVAITASLSALASISVQNCAATPQAVLECHSKHLILSVPSGACFESVSEATQNLDSLAQPQAAGPYAAQRLLSAHHASALLPVLASGASGKRCRCLPSDACWPTASAFDALAAQLSQPLLHPVPPESVCYPAAHPAGNCAAAQASADEALWRAEQPGAMQAPNFETYTFANGTIDACYLNATLGAPCGQGSVPVVGVNATSAQDVQKAVVFAGERTLRLVIKNTGHDYLGRSTARGSFLVWTHHLKTISVHDDFVPADAPQSQKYDAITLGAGVQWHEAYAAVQARGRVMVGGISVNGSVGAAGGWVLGGGHSILSPTYGLGVDNALQFTVVAASGAHLTVSEHAYADLFWALRGGGGGTYGVVTSVTYRTYASPPLAAAVFSATTTDADTYYALVMEVFGLFTSLTDAGWGGYGSVYPSAQSVQVFFGSPGKSGAQANETFKPFFDFVVSLDQTKIAVQAASTVSFGSFYDAYNAIFAEASSQVGTNDEIVSRLLSRSLLVNDTKAAVDTLLSLPYIGFNVIGGGAVSRVEPDSVGLNSAWREALVEVYTSIGWPDGTPSAEIDQLRNGLKDSIKLLSSISDATYINEASLYEPEWQNTFFGSHFDKLKAIKAKYDPHSLFVVAEGVGSEDWNEDLTCLLY